jgi:hypothetical protein
MIVDFNSETWNNPWVRKLGFEEKVLFIYLWTNSHKGIAGIYPLDAKTMAFETGIDHDRIDSALKALEPKVWYDHEKGLVWVKNHVKHQFLPNRKLSPKIAIAIKKNLLAVSPHPFVEGFLQYYPLIRKAIA